MGVCVFDSPREILIDNRYLVAPDYFSPFFTITAIDSSIWSIFALIIQFWSPFAFDTVGDPVGIKALVVWDDVEEVVWEWESGVKVYHLEHAIG